jgi:hypothetical protein
MRSLREYSRTSFASSAPSAWEKHSGTAHIFFVALAALSLVSGGLYVFSVNRSAVQGYAIRQLEKELKGLKKENAELRVREAEVKSLARVEAGSRELRMDPAVSKDFLTLSSGAVAAR